MQTLICIFGRTRPTSKIDHSNHEESTPPGTDPHGGDPSQIGASSGHSPNPPLPCPSRNQARVRRTRTGTTETSRRGRCLWLHTSCRVKPSGSGSSQRRLPLWSRSGRRQKPSDLASGLPPSSPPTNSRAVCNEPVACGHQLPGSSPLKRVDQHQRS